MCALFHEVTSFQHKNPARIPDRAQSVCDHERRTVHKQLVQALVHGSFRLRIERARRFVEYQHRRPVIERPGNRDPLLLTAA